MFKTSPIAALLTIFVDHNHKVQVLPTRGHVTVLEFIMPMMNYSVNRFYHESTLCITYVTSRTWPSFHFVVCNIKGWERGPGDDASLPSHLTHAHCNSYTPSPITYYPACMHIRGKAISLYVSCIVVGTKVARSRHLGIWRSGKPSKSLKNWLLYTLNRIAGPMSTVFLLATPIDYNYCLAMHVLSAHVHNLLGLSM